MGTRINAPVNEGVFIEYNGYQFPTKAKARLSARPQMDDSKRIEVAKIYTLRVKSPISPRRPIPGDDSGTGIQLRAPYAAQPIPGIDPNHIAATTDSEMRLLLCRLQESGKTLRYVGYGMGDIYVNTIDPNTGLFVQDLNYGPHCKIITARPLAFNKAWEIEWECEFTLATCCEDESSPDYNDVGKRIQEYNYAVSYSYNYDGMCKRTITGKLVIIPPMFRELLPLGQQGAISSLDPNAKATLKLYNDISEQIIAVEKTIKSATITVKNAQDVIFRIVLNNPDLQNVDIFSITDSTALQDILDDIGTINPVVEVELIDAFEAYITANTRLKPLYDSLRNLRSGANDLQKEVDALRTISFNQARFPADITVVPSFPKAAGVTGPAVAVNQTWGPYNEDNAGNIQNFETVDQYRDYVYENIPIPFNFQRTSYQFDISMDKRSMRFTIIDEERPSFSFISGYSKVDIRHSTSSSSQETLLNQWNSTISARFHAPKFINSSTSAIGYSQMGIQEVENLSKIVPDKQQYFIDFMKLVYQRFALALVQRTNINNTIQLPDGTNAPINVGTVIPISFSINENVLGTDVEFSMTFRITTNFNFIWQMVGHGLPCILAADLDADSALAMARRAKATVNDALGYAVGVKWAKYTDILAHRDWLISQKYATGSARGSAINLILDRSNDRLVNICSNPEDAELVIPYHGNIDPISSAGAANRSPVPIKVTDITAVEGLWASLKAGFTSGGVGAYIGTSGIDIYLEDNLGIGNNYVNEALTTPNLGTSNFTKFSAYASFEQDVDSPGAIWELAEDVVLDNVMNMIGIPSPENSWLQYYSELEVITDNRRVRHKLTPKEDYSPQYNIAGQTGTIIESHFDSIVPVGPDNLNGESIDANFYSNNPPADDIIQTTASPSTVLILRGIAVRSHYQVVPPTLIMYGNQRAYQRRRRVRQGMIGKTESTLFRCVWEIEYILGNTPSGALPSPLNPQLFAADDIDMSTTVNTENLQTFSKYYLTGE